MGHGQEKPRSGARVLVVEDETKMRELLVKAVSGWGFPAAGARSGEEALRMLEAEAREIVLLDLNLPGMHGMEVFERVRARFPGTQVIVMTGFGDLESAKRAIRLDVVDFLTKPCHLGELEQAIDRARKRLGDEAVVVEETGEADKVEATRAPVRLARPTPPADGSGETLEEVERRYILSALERNAGNRTATAAELGISLRTLYYRLAEYQKQGFTTE